MAKKLLLLLLVILSHYADSDSSSIVKFLPGFEGPLPFELETGYIGVKEEVQLFYYFVKSERNPKEDPLLIWITEGPGCSSLTGLFLENGPVTFKTKGYNGGSPTLVSTTYSWTKVASIIYLDQPVGVGFSYATTQPPVTPTDTGEAKRIYEFIHKWLGKHKVYISNPLYVAGDSYSGIVIPAAVQEISKGNDLGSKPKINLQGYVLGNPTTDQEVERNAHIPFAHEMALISDELYDCISGINEEHILQPTCDVETPKLLSPNYVPRRYLKGLLQANLPVSSTDCVLYSDLLPFMWANDESVRKALHIAKGTVEQWVRCYRNISYQVDIICSVPYHMNNSMRGYCYLIYSGDHDMGVPYTTTQAWIRSLNYSIIDDWRPWMINNQVAGYTRTYDNNMTFVTIKGGGHTIDYKPEESFIMFKRWISGQLL